MVGVYGLIIFTTSVPKLSSSCAEIILTLKMSNPRTNNLILKL